MIANDWIDKKEYPFNSKYIELDMGNMHYISEGDGKPIVMVHGNPSWSFLYRYIIKKLSEDYRCIAMDHIGFGLSDKPKEWPYLPMNHAENLEKLINDLKIEDITLIVQDWGGPIGLSYAINNPDNVRRIVVINSWMWSVIDDSHHTRFSKFMGSFFGRFLIKRFNFYVKVVMKMGINDKSNFPKEVRQHYLNPLKKSADRKGCWTLPKEVIGSSEWLENLWMNRDKISSIPALFIWGMKDIAFREKELATWESLFTNSKTIRLDNIGHFVQEELKFEICPFIQDFLTDL